MSFDEVCLELKTVKSELSKVWEMLEIKVIFFTCTYRVFLHSFFLVVKVCYHKEQPGYSFYRFKCGIHTTLYETEFDLSRYFNRDLVYNSVP